LAAKEEVLDILDLATKWANSIIVRATGVESGISVKLAVVEQPEKRFASGGAALCQMRAENTHRQGGGRRKASIEPRQKGAKW